MATYEIEEIRTVEVDGKRPLGKPRRRWEQSIKMNKR
jgi:RNase P/RNase MRP subunit p29